jgi:hypothetical protein
MDNTYYLRSHTFINIKKVMTRKTNTVLIGLLGTILMGLSTWVLVTLIETQTIVSMMQNELMNIDKQFGRVYNFIDSVRTKD